MEHQEFKAAVSEGNLAEAVSIVQAIPLQSFTSHPLHVAVVGELGSGKSSFINAVLGLRADDEGAAESGVRAMGTEAKAYQHPVLSHVTLWDLPGLGAPCFSPDARAEQVDLSRFDFFIIVGSQRFRSAHAELVREIQTMVKRFYFVRSKADADLEASRRQRPSTYDEERILQQIREDCRTCLRAEEVSDLQVFVVSSWEPNRFDFPLLQETWSNELLSLKRQTFLRHLLAISFSAINEKKASMQRGIWRKALLLGAITAFSSLAGLIFRKYRSECSMAFGLDDGSLAAAVSIPALSFLAGLFVFRKYRSECYTAFGLNDRSLAALAQQVGNPMAELKAVIKSPGMTPLILARLPLDAVGVAVIIAEYSWKRLPIFGCLVLGGNSFLTTYFLLPKCLARAAENAQRVLTKALEAEGKKSV